MHEAPDGPALGFEGPPYATANASPWTLSASTLAPTVTGLLGPPIDERGRVPLDGPGLSERAKDAVATLSGSLARRLELAGALLTDS